MFCICLEQLGFLLDISQLELSLRILVVLLAVEVLLEEDDLHHRSQLVFHSFDVLTQQADGGQQLFVGRGVPFGGVVALALVVEAVYSRGVSAGLIVTASVLKSLVVNVHAVQVVG